MRKRIALLLVGLALFLGIILMVALRRSAPNIPGNELHAALKGRPDDCMTCHGPAGAKPRGPNHPLGKGCWGCHFETGEVR